MPGSGPNGRYDVAAYPDDVDAVLEALGLKKVLQTTFAALPAAADHIGYANVSDVGLNGSLWQSDGTIWRPVAGRVLLASTAVASALHTGTLTETTIDTISIPGNLMGLNGSLEYVIRWSATNSANTKTFRARFGGTIVNDPQITSGTATIGMLGRITNRNSLSSQLGANGSGVYSGTPNAWRNATIDTSAAVNLTITAQLNNIADSITREAYEVWLIR
jgi:hypothetical protein